ncbi:MAG TPA: DUF4097 family beta strand repeat-containing protein [Cyclobacteriaceae bacterium]|nr:DUF4097 family beta strand repeat-containing protein [Cyclobacteriaceae bacterium]
MKTITKVFFSLILALCTIFSVYSQENGQQLVIPLSNPDKPGLLDINVMSGTIKVTGYAGKDVIINVSTDQRKYEQGDESRDGLKRIPNNSIGLNAKEYNNTVKVNSENWNKKVDLNIQVPKAFDLTLKGINDGEILVENVTGEIDAGHVNGEISLINISGTALANTTNGDVKVTFLSVNENSPMAFSSFNGNVDITFPASLKATVKMKSDQGELYTDFDMVMRKTTPTVDSKKESGEYKISMDGWVTGDVNGGGPEISFKTFNGDIILRKK